MVYEKYDSIFRRGLIEYKPGTKAQKRAKYRAHDMNKNIEDIGEEDNEY